MEEKNETDPDLIVAGFARKSVALAPGEPRTISLSLENRDSRERRLGVAILGIPAAWIGGAAKHTVTIPAGQKFPFTVTVQPSASSPGEREFTLLARVTDLETDEIVATPVLTLTLTTETTEPAAKIEVAEAEVVAAPGSVSTVRLRVRNLGGEADHFELGVYGIPAGWVSTALPVLYLGPGEARNAELDIQIPPAPQVRAGRYPVTIRVTKQSAAGRTAESTFTVVVAAFRSSGRIGVLAESLQFSVAPGSGTEISLILRNQGLQDDRFRLGVSGIPVAWASTTTPVTALEPGEERRVTLTVRPPLAPQSRAGRHNFKIKVQSERVPDEFLEVPAILTVTAFQEFDSSLTPQQLQAGGIGQLTINNRGNSRHTYTLEWKSENDALTFAAVLPPNSNLASEQAPQDENTQSKQGGPRTQVRVDAGSSTTLAFRATLRRRPVIGREKTVPYTVEVSAEDRRELHSSTVVGQPMIPIWVAFILLTLCLLLTSAAALLLLREDNRSADATSTAVAQATQFAAVTQTASANQTRAVAAGEEDTDGDGLVNSSEIQLGTDPNNPDTDADALSDGDEVLTWTTDPLNPDTDGDILPDGDEVRRGTDPLNSDSDADQLTDGDEVQRSTDPLNPDTDGDGLSDGDEVLRWSTNPLAADTDNDQLTDAQEVAACPDPLNPDTDGDGTIDGIDLDPCDPNNPSLTATAVAGIATEPPDSTPLPPTETVPPEATPEPTLAPTLPPTLPDLPGLIAFSSNRDGRQQIYASIDPTGANVARLTTSNADDTEAAWSPDGSRIAFVSNRDGNPEIYLMNADGGNPTRLTDNPADDVHPSWSPDGDAIAFSTNRDGNYEIYVMALDGSDQRPLTDNAAADREPFWFRGSDGLLSSTDYILFTTDRDGNQEIYRMDPDGSNLLNLTNNPAADQNPAGLSAGNGVDNSSGRRILFTSDRDANSNILVMDLDGGNPTNLTANPASDFQPTWSADGEWFAFATDRTGNLEVFVQPAAGGEALNLSNNSAADQGPIWR